MGTVTCSVTHTADKRMLVILKKASSHLWSSSPPNSLSEDREERMATKGLQILPKQSISHGSLNKDLKIERKDHPEYLQSELAGQQQATAHILFCLVHTTTKDKDPLGTKGSRPRENRRCKVRN